MDQDGQTELYKQAIRLYKQEHHSEIGKVYIYLERDTIKKSVDPVILSISQRGKIQKRQYSLFLM